MLTPTRLIVALAAPLALAACGSEADEPDKTGTVMASNMPMNGQTTTADGSPMMQAEAGTIGSTEGTVTKVDDAAGTITIDHGPVPAVEWPAMTMGFSADEGQRASVAAGDKVTFTFRKTEQGGEIVSLSKK